MKRKTIESELMNSPGDSKGLDVDEEEGGYDKKQKHEPGRALYVGNLNAAGTTYYDLCSLANEFGSLEMVKVVPHKGCAFLNFVEESAAKAFFDAAAEKPLQLGENAIKVRWAKATKIKDELLEKIKAGATRNLFVGNLGETVDEDTLAHVFGRYGPFENIVILRARGIGFVNLTSIRNAIAAKSALDGSDLMGRRIKVNFAKEKVGAKRPQGGRPPAGRSLLLSQQWPAPDPLVQMAPPPFYNPMGGQPQFFPPEMVDPMHAGSRAIYLGNIAEEVTPHDLCKVANRFGAIESVKIVKTKQCAFLNFVDGGAANAFFLASKQQPIVLGTQPLRVNWAKSTPLSPDLLAQVRAGATRNLFVANVEEHISEEMLRDIFAPFGEFDTIVILRPKKIAFVNMTSLKSALRAKDALQGHSIGEPAVQLKINFAKENPGRARGTGGRRPTPTTTTPGSPSYKSSILLEHGDSIQ